MKALRRAARIIKLDRDDLRIHDVRRGTFAELATCVKSGGLRHIAGSGLGDVGGFTGHSRLSAAATVQYIGDDSTDTWKGREKLQLDHTKDRKQPQHIVASEVLLADVLELSDILLDNTNDDGAIEDAADDDVDKDTVELDVVDVLEALEKSEQVETPAAKKRIYSQRRDNYQPVHTVEYRNLDTLEFVDLFSTINLSTLQNAESQFRVACKICDEHFDTKTGLIKHEKRCRSKEETVKLRESQAAHRQADKLPCSVAGCIWEQSVVSRRTGLRKDEKIIRRCLMAHLARKHGDPSSSSCLPGDKSNEE